MNRTDWVVDLAMAETGKKDDNEKGMAGRGSANLKINRWLQLGW